MKNLTPEHLTKLADLSIHEFERRVHEVPPKDLPACAAVLLQLAAKKPVKTT